uniref:Uncharacterized protein n=1 Tax=Setaria viridis TaxID=4556 RepID=A0A4U6UDQ9_SETVI|nr:hypothetical protein SEVIR_5G147100v2 [Setaria viridis]
MHGKLESLVAGASFSLLCAGAFKTDKPYHTTSLHSASSHLRSPKGELIVGSISTDRGLGSESIQKGQHHTYEVP